MTDEERKDLRRRLGRAIIEVQDNHQSIDLHILLPELIAALLSLAANIAYKNTCMNRHGFEAMVKIAIEENFEPPDARMQDFEGPLQ